MTLGGKSNFPVPDGVGTVLPTNRQQPRKQMALFSSFSFIQVEPPVSFWAKAVTFMARAIAIAGPLIVGYATGKLVKAATPAGTPPLVRIAAGTATGALAGVLIGSAIPVIGPVVGLGIGAVAGAVGAWFA